MDKLDKLIFEYVEKFDDVIPIYQMPQMTDDELAVVIEEAIKNDKPIEVPNVEGRVY